MWCGLILVYSVLCQSSGLFCPENQQLDITKGSFVNETTIKFDGLLFSGDEWFRNNVSIVSCPCLKRTCVWKCCGAHEAFLNASSSCGDADYIFEPPLFEGARQLNLTASQPDLFYMHNKLCEERYVLDPVEEEGLNLYLQVNGSLLEVNPLGSEVHPAPSYCLEQMLNEEGSPRLVAVRCFSEQSVDSDATVTTHFVYGIGLLISVSFLVATLLVYAVVPELRTLHGQCLMAYCAGLIVGYSLLAFLKISTQEDDIDKNVCILIAFAVYYAFQTSFFWLNVMCIDIWNTFRGFRGSQRGPARRFLLWGVYAWGVPAALLALVAAMQLVDLPATIIAPHIGLNKCWFDSWHAELTYFYAPMFLVMMCNCILFIMTAVRIHTIHQEAASHEGEGSANNRFHSEKHRCGSYLKLFMVMGLNWLVELLSSVVGGSSWYWMVLDISILAMGFFIFMIFVCNKKIWILLKRRVRKVPEDSGVARLGISTAVTEDPGGSTEDTFGLQNLN